MEPSKKSPLKLATGERTPREIKMMKMINIFVISFVGVFVVILIACALNGLSEIAFYIGCALLVILWNYRVIRRKYARGL